MNDFWKYEDKQKQLTPTSVRQGKPAWMTGQAQQPQAPQGWFQRNVLQPFGKAAGWYHEKVLQPISAAVTAPWSPAVEGGRPGESWFERELREYRGWEAPKYAKGVSEFFLDPLWLIGLGAPAVGLASKAGIMGPRAVKAVQPLLKAERGGLKVLAAPIELPLKGVAKIVKPAIQRFREPVSRLFELPAVKEHMGQLFTQDWQRRMAQTLGKVPVVRGVVRAIGGPAAAVKNPWDELQRLGKLPRLEREATIRKLGDKEMENMVMGVVVMQEDVLRRLGGTVNQGLAHLKMQGDSLKLFGIDKNAMCQAIRPKAGYEQASRAVSDVFENPKIWQLTPEQQLFIDTSAEVWTKMEALMVKEGLSPQKMIFPEGGQWLHRKLIGKRTPEGKLYEITKPTGVADRYYTRELDGFNAGIRYEPNPIVRLQEAMNNGSRQIAQKRAAELIKPLGAIPIERAPVWVREQYFAKTLELKQAKGATSVAWKALSAGYRPSLNTIQALKRSTNVAVAAAGKKLHQLFPEATWAFRHQPEVVVREATKVIQEAEEAYIKAGGSKIAHKDADMIADGLTETWQRVDRGAAELEAEIEYLAQAVLESPVLSTRFPQLYTVTVKGVKQQRTRYVSLADIVPSTGQFKGEIAYLTKKQYEMITGKEARASILTPDGKNVRWEYALDDIAKTLGYEERAIGTRYQPDELLRLDIETAWADRRQLEGLKGFLAEERETIEAIRRFQQELREGLEHKLPRPEFGMPEAGVQAGAFGVPEKVVRPIGPPEVQTTLEAYGKLLEAKPVVLMGKEVRETTLKGMHKSLKEAETVARLEYFQARALHTREMAAARKAGPIEGMIRRGAYAGRVFPQEVSRAMNKYYEDVGSKWMEVASTLSGTSRTLVAALDLSAPFIQGLAGMARHPKQWATATGKMFQFFKNPQLLHEYMIKAENVAAREARIAVGGTTQTFEYFERLVGLYGVAERMPGKAGVAARKTLETTYGRAEAAFTGFGEVFRDEMWKAMAPRHPNELAELARHLDRLTGVMSTSALGIPLTQRQIESGWLFFAPRYTRAGFALVGDVFKGGLSGAEARKALGSMAGAGLAMYFAICFKLGQEPNLDSSTGRFMTIKVGHEHIGIGSFMTSFVRFAADVTASALSIGENKPMDFTTMSRWDNPFLRFMYNKSAPLTGAISSLASHKDYLGEPIETPAEYGRYLADLVTPIWMQAATTQQPRAQVPALAAEFAGLRAFPKSTWERLGELRDYHAQTQYRRDYDQLDQLEKRKVNQRPDVEKLADEAKEEQQRRFGGEPYTRWQVEVDANRGLRSNRWEMLQREYDAGRLTGRDLRQKVADIMGQYVAVSEAVNARYPEVMERFEEAREKPKQFVFDKAYDEYVSLIYDPRLEDEYGNPAYDEINRRKQLIRQKYGEAVWAKVQEYLMLGRGEPPVVLELRQARELLRPYWEIRDTLYNRYPQLKRLRDEIDRLKASGDPQDYLRAQYISKMSPQLRQVERMIEQLQLRWRVRNPEGNRLLQKFYGRAPLQARR